MSKKKLDFSIRNNGPCYIDPSIKKPGYHYILVGDLPGQIEMYQRWGFEIVKGDVATGSNHASENTALGSSVTIKSKCGQTMYLMASDDEDYQQFQGSLHDLTKQKLQSLGHLDGVPENSQIGDVKFGVK